MNRILLSFLGLVLLSMGHQEPSGTQDKSSVVTGTVFITGSEPHTQVALRTSAGEVFLLTGALAESLRRYQSQTVTLKGRTEPLQTGFKPSRILEVQEILDK